MLHVHAQFTQHQSKILCIYYVAYMLTRLSTHQYALIDDTGLPRYWATAWSLLVGRSLATSTLKRHLANIDAFYLNAEFDRQPGALDDTLGDLNLPLLEEMLEAYFVLLTNVPDVGSMTEQRWKGALSFVRDVCERLACTPAMSACFEDLLLRLERLKRLYGQLRATKRPKPTLVQSLPATVPDAFYDAVLPSSGRIHFPIMPPNSARRSVVVSKLKAKQ